MEPGLSRVAASLVADYGVSHVSKLETITAAQCLAVGMTDAEAALFQEWVDECGPVLAATVDEATASRLAGRDGVQMHRILSHWLESGEHVGDEITAVKRRHYLENSGVDGCLRAQGLVAAQDWNRYAPELSKHLGAPCLRSMPAASNATNQSSVAGLQGGPNIRVVVRGPWLVRRAERCDAMRCDESRLRRGADSVLVATRRAGARFDITQPPREDATHARYGSRWQATCTSSVASRRLASARAPT